MYVLSLTKLLKTKVVHKNESQCCSICQKVLSIKLPFVTFDELSDKGTFMQKNYLHNIIES